MLTLLPDTALLQVAELEKLPQPSKKYLQELRRWLKDPKGGNNFVLRSGEARTWHESSTSDLVSVTESTKKELFSRFLDTTLVSLYHHFWGDRHQVHIPASHLYRMTIY